MTTTVPGRDVDDARRAELREFLMARRARVTPEEAGLPAGPRRRTPGLRREEVAVLAGVGVSWYQWLEQGRDITVSQQVLDAVARVLRLNEAERRHLYVLAGLNPPLPEIARPGTRPVDPVLVRLMDAWMPSPAHIMDRYWTVVAVNRSANLVFDIDVADNCLTNYFTKPAYRTRYTPEIAALIVAQYRYEMAAFPGDPGFTTIVDDLASGVPEFAELWARHDVHNGGITVKHITHPEAGRMVFESAQLRVPERPDLRIIIHNPLPDTDTADRVRTLLATPRDLVA